ncbi:MAG: hypothetical protein WB792_12820, partial [Desulfobacterales bacterium]
QTDQTNYEPDSKNKAPPSLAAAEKHPETDPRHHPSDLALHKLNERENPKTAASGEDPAKKQPRMPASMASARQYKNDWFDKLLDFFCGHCRLFVSADGELVTPSSS